MFLTLVRKEGRIYYLEYVPKVVDLVGDRV